MTDERKELIERWAREADVWGAATEEVLQEGPGLLPALQRFAALVRADALEEAAKVAESTIEGGAWIGSSQTTWGTFKGVRSASAIRKLIQAP